MPQSLEELQATLNDERVRNEFLKAKYAESQEKIRALGASAGGTKTALKRKEEGIDPFSKEAREHSHESARGYPAPMPPYNVTNNSSGFKSFAQKIRHKTKDGWELVDAVYEVFCRARTAQADQLIIESATWLADRGFGKPVQVGQLLDAEGNAVAFTLWSPASRESEQDVITIQDGKVIETLPPGAYASPKLDPPKEVVPDKPDGYASGIARDWAKK